MKRNRLRERIVATCGAVLLIPAAAAHGAGGPTIAAAPALPLDQVVVGGGTGAVSGSRTLGTWFYQEFYRLPLEASDKVTVDYQSNDQHTVNLAFFAPSITDFTIPEKDPVGLGGAAASGATYEKSELTFTAPSPGSWTVYLYNECQSCYQDDASMSYALTAHVQHFTKILLHVPRAIKRGRMLRVSGSVFGVAGGHVMVRVRGVGHPLHNRVSVDSAGRFHWRGRMRRPGRYRVHVRYAGDGSHLASAADAQVRVSAGR